MIEKSELAESLVCATESLTGDGDLGGVVAREGAQLGEVEAVVLSRVDLLSFGSRLLLARVAM